MHNQTLFNLVNNVGLLYCSYPSMICPLGQTYNIRYYG